MVQLFQRYVPYSSVVHFMVQSLLCLTAFTLVVQVAWYTQLDPTLPSLAGVRLGRIATTVATLVSVFYLTGYFERRNHLSTALFVPRLIQAVPLSAATLALLYQFVPSVALGGEVAGAGLGLMALMMIAWHCVAPSMVSEDTLAENILLIGDGELAYQVADRVGNAAPWGFRLIGYVPVDDAPPYDAAPHEARASPSAIAHRLRGGGAVGNTALALDADSRVLPFPVPLRIDAPALGRLQDLDAILSERDVHTIVVALSDRRGKLPLAALIRAKLRGVAVFDAIEFYERLTGRLLVSRMRPSTIIFSDGFAPGRISRAMKRFLDVAVASTLLVISAPVQLLVAIAVALTSRGPVLFRQGRTGIAGLPFTILKFRTMRVDAESEGPRWAAENDDRITSIGRFLRTSRLNELPQLWNILLGHTSFVGPRPEQPAFVRMLRNRIPYYDQRHVIRPGLTGWAQVKYPYGASVEETVEKLEYDLYYIKHSSIAFDVTIMFETVRVMLTGKGAR